MLIERRDGSSAQIRQDALPTSAYHAGLAASVHDDSAPNAVSASQSLYWADYSRVYYAPGTFQRVPDVQSDWAAGRAVFTRYDTVSPHWRKVGVGWLTDAQNRIPIYSTRFSGGSSKNATPSRWEFPSTP
jgi:hypothetical protein